MLKLFFIAVAAYTLYTNGDFNFVGEVQFKVRNLLLLLHHSDFNSALRLTRTKQTQSRFGLLDLISILVRLFASLFTFPLRVLIAYLLHSVTKNPLSHTFRDLLCF